MFGSINSIVLDYSEITILLCTDSTIHVPLHRFLSCYYSLGTFFIEYVKILSMSMPLMIIWTFVCSPN